MPADPSVIKAVQSVREAISPQAGGRDMDSAISSIGKLFRKTEKIAGDIGSLGEVLALAAEVEACRGPGAQWMVDEFSIGCRSLAYHVKSRLPQSRIKPEFFPKEEELRVIAGDTDVLACHELLAAHVFARTQGPPVRSRRAGSLRADYWGTLARIAEILRRPEHLAHALKVAADKRASISERAAAVRFLQEYWGVDDPDKATVGLLEELMENPPGRDFLVTVMEARVDLGLDDEFDALCAVEDWDDDCEEE